VAATTFALLFTFTVGRHSSSAPQTTSGGLISGRSVPVAIPSGTGGFAQAQAGAALAPYLAAPKASGATEPAANTNLVLGNPPGDIERTVDATYDVPHKDFYSAFNEVISHAVNDEGGFVVSTTTSPDATGRMVAGTVVVKVPTDKLSNFLAALPSGTFTPSSINFATIDHTSEYIDDQARLDEAQQELDALQRALAATSDPATIASLTQQIATAQQNLEQQQAAFAVVQQAVALSTATIHLKELGAVAAPVPAVTPILTRTTQSAFNNDVWIVSELIYGVLTALPLLLIVLILALARRRILRAARAVVS
jgi:hypothetical protein